MNYLLYGEDTYRSRKKLREIIEEYRAKTGSSLSFYRLDAEEDDMSRLKVFTQTSSLFSPKKLIVIEGALSGSEQFGHVLSAAKEIKESRDTVLLLWERELDDTTRKRLKEIEPYLSKTQEFKPLSREAVSRWIQEEAKKLGVRLFPVHLAKLSILGSDLWAISSELDKIAVANPQSATTNPQTIDERSIFQLGDTFFVSRREALFNLLGLLAQGENELGIFSYLVNHARTLLTVKTYTSENRVVPASLGIHPFVVKKAAAVSRGLPVEHLRSTMGRFLEEDFKIKTGLTKPAESLFRLLTQRS
ncbi:MAG: hypothetical protein HYW89_02710 [Candidatus Sungiibacteriota bacterium]|uniref:DNA polymerase III subunit delta n=1 Tax=Candidatus Sungiibacteriota bacterium TaxID=2750080 RepID=A0A7T5UQY3_9BACT|nr:MAG: hypothetical protein HYW89_02710 [Candidatus Sungbacteria bacterium]